MNEAMSLSERVVNYHHETGFPESLFVGGDGRIVGTWIMGNDYRVKSKYYGGYPADYLRRVRALFPEKKHILHLFSGRVDVSVYPGHTLDSNPKLQTDWCDNAETLEKVPTQFMACYDLVLADPPYSTEDCEHYGTPMVNRNKVMSALGARLAPGTHVVWLDQVLPMYRKDQFFLEAVIGMVKSTNHRFRVVTIFRKNRGELSVLEAQEKRVCRYCKIDDHARPGNAFVLAYGDEYAHEACIKGYAAIPLGK